MLDTVDRLFEAPFFSTPATTTNHPISASLRSPWDVMEDEDTFRLRIDMPGLNKEEVSWIFREYFSHYDDLLSNWCLECIVRCGEKCHQFPFRCSAMVLNQKIGSAL